jgi:hypothetical protein
MEDNVAVDFESFIVIVADDTFECCSYDGPIAFQRYTDDERVALLIVY